MKNPSPYLKMRVLGALDSAEGRTRDARVRTVAGMTFTDEDGHPRRFTWRTIQTWHYRYKNYGITGMNPQPRKDKGRARKVTPEELLEAINAALPHFHEKRHTKMCIYRYCIEKGLLDKNRIAQTTYFRFIREHGFLKPDTSDHKRRLAFAMQYANQLWQADTLYGPCVASGPQGAPRATRLIAFLDDASRVLCHGEFFLEENIDSLIKAFQAALYKRGVPEQLLVDNGSIYASQELTLICARVGCILRHTAVRDAAAKGKIERFLKRVRDQFLVRQLDLSSLEALNRQFTAWAESDYNASVHSALDMKPIDRFGLDLRRIRFLPPSDANDELFYAETHRKVKKDNTFSFRNQRYETPVDLRDKDIQIRYQRHAAGPIVVYFKGQRMGLAQPLDLIANGLLRRKED
jgi:transposase InsO family protein